MQMTPLQCRLGRTAVGWSANELAAASGVAVNTVTKFERGGDARVSTVNAMKAVLEYAGVEFVAEGKPSPSGGEGIRFSPSGLSPLDRMTADREQLAMQLATAKAEKLGNTGPAFSRALGHAAKSGLIRTLEEQIADFDRRISRLMAMRVRK